MIQAVLNIYDYRELLLTLAWKNIVVRYKQSYLGIAWAFIQPLIMTLLFMIIRSFVGIETGGMPYPVLTFCALIPWTLFNEATTEGVRSIVNNSTLIRKIYFPREILPITSILSKMLDLGISLIILGLLMAYYRVVPTIHILWVPLIILYIMVVVLSINMGGSALYVFYRDIGAALSVVMSLLMYVSPVIYPLSIVEKSLLVKKAAGPWSELCFTLFTLNPMVGAIDAFQKALLYGKPPDLSVIWPGALLTFAMLPVSYLLFKKAENHFADVI